MAGRQVVLTFHGIGKPSPRASEDEGPFWLSERFFCEIVDRVAEMRMQGHDVQITFDDGNRSDICKAVPILMSRGLNAQFFPLTGRLSNPDFLTARDLKMLVGMGMSVGLHGRDHVDWRGLSKAHLDSEIRSSRAALEEILECSVETVSLPFGSYDRGVISHLKSLAFRTIYTSDGGPTKPRSAVKNRTTVRSDMTIMQVWGILEGRQSLKARVRRAFKTVFLH